MSKKAIYYGIDMGAPHAGFYAWRWDVSKQQLTAFGPREWNECIAQIRKDYGSSSKVVLGIEAAMWGAKLNKKTSYGAKKETPEGKWVSRFEVKIPHRTKIYQEQLWCTSAGAATSVMAQAFLGQICHNLKSIKNKKIRIYETYISGLKGFGHAGKISKPESPVIRINNKKDAGHAEDALEALALVYEADGNEFSVELLNKLETFPNKYSFKEVKNWSKPLELNKKLELKKTFKIGILDTDKRLELVENTILFTRRLNREKKAA